MDDPTLSRFAEKVLSRFQYFAKGLPEISSEFWDAAKKSRKKDQPTSTVAAARGRKGSGSPAKAWGVFKSIAGTIAIFLILRTFLVEAYRIPSGSMIPTMLVGDWLFVNKLRFGPHVPFTSVNPPATPSRGAATSSSSSRRTRRSIPRTPRPRW